jgi:hypothetical protein
MRSRDSNRVNIHIASLPAQHHWRFLTAVPGTDDGNKRTDNG